MDIECCGTQTRALYILLLLHVDPNWPPATISFTDIGAILFHRSLIFTITRVFFHLQCRQSYYSVVNDSVDAAGKNVPLMLQLITMTNLPRLDRKYFITVKNTLMTHTLECRDIRRRGNSHTQSLLPKKHPYLTTPVFKCRARGQCHRVQIHAQ